MDAWIFQPGYPAISVARDGDRVRFTQHRFLPSNPDDDTTWPVPLMVRQVAGGDERLDRILVEAGGAELLVAAMRSCAERRLGELRPRVVRRRAPRGSSIERWRSSRRSSATAWSTTPGPRSSRARRRPARSSTSSAVFGDETDLRVWQAILGGLGWLDRFVDDEPRERLRAFVRDLVRPALARLGWDPEDDETDLTRAAGPASCSRSRSSAPTRDDGSVPRARAGRRG